MAEADGQAVTAPETTTQTAGPQTSQTAPESQSTSAQATSTGSAAAETFFDPESIKGKPELEAAYKQMQGEWTRRTTELKKHEQKIKAYDAFAANPAQAIQEVAAQYGYKLTKAEAQAIANERPNEFQPTSWDDVVKTAVDRAKKEVLGQLEPFVNKVKETAQSQTEKMLDENCPDWRVYEDKMMKNLQTHPTLVNDPVMLYRLSVPPEVLESRAAQSAIRKLQDKVNASELSGGSTTTQQASDKPKGKLTFNQAVEYAKASVAAKGIRPPNTH